MSPTQVMNPRPVAGALDGEHVAGVYPRSAADLAIAWHRRLNLFTGRALTAPALGVEQTGRAGAFALRGQVMSPGVVQGLQASLETNVAMEQVGEVPRAITRYYINIAQGRGIAASGEDVVVSQPVRVNIGDIEVVAPASLHFGTVEGPPPPDSDGVSATPLDPPDVRRVWGSLGSLLQQNAELPPVGVLVLEPVTFESVASGDTGDDCGSGSTNPCALDADAVAFEDWQLVDGCRLLLYAWPSDSLTMPVQDDRWRNRLAWTVFNAERGRAAESPLPWEEFGVPIALVAFDTLVSADRQIHWDRGEIPWAPLFADRNTVVRLGGRPKRRRPIPGVETNEFLWQARVQQLIEQIAGTDPSLPPAQIAAQFRFLPPVGLLPKNVTDARGGHDHFFPSTYVVNAAPIPLEQIDILLDESAALSPFDLFTADEVRVYVPVPQIYYEPDLLQTAVVDAEFQRSIDAFSLRRGRWLARRNEVRAKASALATGITGKPLDFPSPDPEALEEEEAAADPIDPNDPLLQQPEDAFGTTAVGTTLIADAVTKLKSDLRARTALRETSSVTLAALPVSLAFPASSQGKAAYDANAKLLSFTGRMTAAQRDDLLNASTDATYRAAVSQLYTTSQDDDISRIDEVGVSGFIDYIQQKANSGDDTVDFGFLRVRTDIYRVRQFMLGTDSATRLTTSPALAEIAQGTSAIASQDQLSAFLQRSGMGTDSATSSSAAAAASSSGSGGTSTTTSSSGTQSVTVNRASTFLLASDRVTVGSTPVAATSAIGGAILGSSTLLQTNISGITKLGTTTASVSDATRTSLINAGAVSSALNLPVATTADVTQQSPIVGKSLEFRNVTVAERLKQPVAPETKAFTVASKYSVLSDVAGLGLNVDDLSVPGFLDAQGNETRHTIRDVRSQGLLTQVINEQHDPDPANGDEGAFFSASVRALENSIATLRLVEGRIQSYRTAASLANSALIELQRQAGVASSRLGTIGNELAEARSDVSVAKALLAEEQARVNGVNDRRTAVLDQHSPFLVYQRTRVSDLIRDLPARAIDPAPAAANADFLSETVTIPPELDAMVSLLRDAPVSWFTHVPQLLDRLDRLETLTHTLGIAKQRAAIAPAAAVPAIAPSNDGSVLGNAVAGLYKAQSQVVASYRAQTAQIDLAAASAQSWASVRTQAVDFLSIGDLVTAVHGRSDVTQRVAQEIDQITHAAAVLLERFSAVLPAIRLDWATRLSEFDAPANLRNLASLPRWGDIEILDRRAMQGIVDWLFGRVDVRQTDAVTMMNSIVRVCILLASHAPVDRIIAGSVHKDTPLRPGIRIDLTVNLAQVRVGMFVNMYSGASVVARGVVEDLASGLASARVTDAVASVTSLAAGARVQLVEPERASQQGFGVAAPVSTAAEQTNGGVRAPAGSLPSLFGSVARALA